MMQGRSRMVLAVAAATALGAAGCGGGSGHSDGSTATAVGASRSEFVAAADKVCSRRLAELEGLTSQGSQIKTTNALASLAGQEDNIAKTISEEFTALHPPPALRDTWIRYLTSFEAVLPLLAQLYEAAEQGNVGEISTLGTAIAASGKRSGDLIQGIGLKSCESAKEKNGGKPIRPSAVPKLGETIPFSGEALINVTVVGVIDPVAAGKFSPSSNDTRWVGVSLIVRNRGSESFGIATLEGKLITSGHESISVGSKLDGECTAPSATVPAHSSLKACFPFEVPYGQDPIRFQFTPGFVDSVTGEWSLVH